MLTIILEVQEMQSQLLKWSWRRMLEEEAFKQRQDGWEADKHEEGGESKQLMLTEILMQY